jgi:nucleotide-binding universal stress UspA family protein
MDTRPPPESSSAEQEPSYLANQILVLSDLSVASRDATWRGALIARGLKASLRILHVARDPRQAGAERASLDAVAGELQERLGIPVSVETGTGDTLKHAMKAASSADLLVVGTRSGNSLLERFAGSQAERLIRHCPVPTLVVKRAVAPDRDAAHAGDALAGRYRKVLVSVGLAEESAGVIGAAMRFARASRMEVFHAVSASKERRGGPGEPSDNARGTSVERARGTITRLIELAGAGEHGAVPAVGFGYAASSVLAKERSTAAELVVVGKRQGGLFPAFSPRGITERVLAASRADVLVVPTRLRNGRREAGESELAAEAFTR